MQSVKKHRYLVCAIALLVGGIVIGRVARVGAEDMDDKKTGDAAKAGGDAAAMMAEMAELAKPGPQHAKLAKYAGDFKADVTMWMDPKQPPMKSTGKLHQDMVLGGKYLLGNYEGSMMNMPFKGMSCTGYDKGKKKWFSGWIDDMGTGLMYAEGDADDAGKVITLESNEQYCPQTKGMIKFREVNTFVDDDSWKMEMFSPGPDGKEMKMMEILYTRVK